MARKRERRKDRSTARRRRRREAERPRVDGDAGREESYIRGFLMAWGCFCWIPCPYRQWHEEDRTAMVAMLPLVGTGLGFVTAVVWGILGGIEAQPLLSGALVTAAYFLATGFIHLDGFMDVSDAVLPRHPDMEVRRRILKDPHTGSFAAVSMALMLLVFAGSAAALSQRWIVGALAFISIATVSRAISAVCVICCPPMNTSQYYSEERRRGSSIRGAIPALVIALLVPALCVVTCLRMPQVSRFAPGLMDNAAESMGADAALIVLAATAVCVITQLILGAADRRSLGGMNGDISGHMITSGEMAGILAAAILAG